MNEITPRWEWRSFGRHFGEAETRLAALTPTGVQESDEVYLLSGTGDNVKVRDALMDIKVLREVNADGLEQWTPVMKAGFPLPAAEAARVFESLRLPVPALSRTSYTLDEFIEAFAQPGGAIRMVKVQKRRVRYRVDGCTAEFSDVTGERQTDPHHRRRVGGCGWGHPRRPGPWPGRLHEHQLSPRPGGPDRR